VTVDLEPTEGKPPEATFEAVVTVDNGTKPHRVAFYLTNAAVGRPVGETLSGFSA
jgi:hypothetical protein